MTAVDVLLLAECVTVGGVLIVRGIRRASTLPNPLVMVLIGVAVAVTGAVGALRGWA